MLAPILALATFVQHSPTASHVEYGSELYHDCVVTVAEADKSKRDGENVVPVLRCTSYVRGFVDGMHVGSLGCFPPSTSTVTLVRVYVNYLKDHPKLMDDSEVDGLLAAFADAYPCTKN